MKIHSHQDPQLLSESDRKNVDPNSSLARQLKKNDEMLPKDLSGNFGPDMNFRPEWKNFNGTVIEYPDGTLKVLSKDSKGRQIISDPPKSVLDKKKKYERIAAEVEARKKGERAKRSEASLLEDENTSDEVREMATDIMATSTTPKLTHPNSFLARFILFARTFIKNALHFARRSAHFQESAGRVN